MPKPEMYFVIHCSEDGDIRVENLTKAELEKRLNEKYWGQAPVFADALPDTDPNYWKGQYVVIKGTIVVPKAVETVTQYEV